jgi:hypothetical protein
MKGSVIMNMTIITTMTVSLIIGLIGCIYTIKKADEGEIDIWYIIGAILGIVAWPVILVGMALHDDLKEGGRA